MLQRAFTTVHKKLRPHIRFQYLKQFKMFLAFVLYHECKTFDLVSTVLCFLEFLANNAFSFRVINNYISALKHYFVRYQWRDQVFEEALIKRLMHGLQYSIPTKPGPKGLFSLAQIKEMSQLCHTFESTLAYRAAFLMAFYGLFRISNLAPVSSF